MNKNRFIIIAAFALLLTIGVVLFFVFRTTLPENGEAEGTAQPFPNAGERQANGQETTMGGARASPEEESAPSFWQLSQEPVAGAAFIDGRVFYAERATGHLFSVGSEGEKRVRLSNTTIPRVLNAEWGAGGDRLLLQYLAEGDALRNVLALVRASSTQITPLDPALITAAPSPDKTQLFVLRPAGDTFSGTVATFENKNARSVLTMPLGRWQARWPATKTVTLLSSPSAESDGSFYALNIDTSAFEKVLGGVPGLVATLSPDNNTVLFSEKTGGAPIALNTFLRETGNTRRLSLATIPEKCAWSQLSPIIAYCAIPSFLPDASYPDDWYKGKISFSDFFTSVDTEKGELRAVFPETFFDATRLFTDKTEQHLFFTDKKSGLLWSIRLP
ncbi:MAG: hypothetical protein HYU35_00350 [Parcubacteria group bacterium]|nr:hypothetical protein [Parcubacteria group bacterium]